MQMQKRGVLHYPNLSTVLEVEKVLKNANEPLSKEEIKRRLPTKIMHQTLNFILAYMENRGLARTGERGVIWTYNPKLQKSKGETARNPNMKKIRQKLAELLKMAKKDKEILAVIVFGSFARKERFEDIDICLVLAREYDSLKMSKKAMQFSIADNFDVHVFQQLPLYIRMRVLKEGKVIFCRNKDILYDLAFLTIREFEDFKPIYQKHVEAVLHG